MSENGNGAKPVIYQRRDYRCMRCGRLLFRACLPEGARVEIRCPKCGGMVVYKSDETGIIAVEPEIMKEDAG